MNNKKWREFIATGTWAGGGISGSMMVMVGEGAVAAACGGGWEEDAALYIEQVASLDEGWEEGTIATG